MKAKKGNETNFRIYGLQEPGLGVRQVLSISVSSGKHAVDAVHNTCRLERRARPQRRFQERPVCTLSSTVVCISPPQCGEYSFRAKNANHPVDPSTINRRGVTGLNPSREDIHTYPIGRAIEVPHAACKDEFRQFFRSFT